MMPLPAKQGLKRVIFGGKRASQAGYDATSSKTRIETIKQILPKLHLSSYDATSSKTRIETATAARVAAVV